MDRKETHLEISEYTARRVITQLIEEGMNYTSLGRIMHNPICGKTLREWATPCIDCGHRARNIKHKCLNQCVTFCLQCFERNSPTLCPKCGEPVDLENPRDSRIRVIGESTFRRVTTNVVFSLQKLRRNEIFDQSIKIIHEETSDMDTQE